MKKNVNPHVKFIVPRGMPEKELCRKNPANLDTSRLLITPTDQFDINGAKPHTTDMKTWRLKVQGDGLGNLSFSYEQILQLPWIIIASVVIGITVVRGFVEFESIFFETVGGVGETIYYLFDWLENYTIVLGILIVCQIPFMYIFLRRLNSELIHKTPITSSARFMKMKTLTISIMIKSGS